jgi:hypothetical protein
MRQPIASPWVVRGRLTLRSAIVWVDRRRALVTRAAPTGALRVREFRIADATDVPTMRYAEVVHAVMDADDVVVMGQPDARLELEREFVAIVKRPDRLREPVRATLDQ